MGESWMGRIKGERRGEMRSTTAGWSGAEAVALRRSAERDVSLAGLRVLTRRLARRRKSPSSVIWARMLPERWMYCGYW